MTPDQLLGSRALRMNISIASLPAREDDRLTAALGTDATVHGPFCLEP